MRPSFLDQMSWAMAEVYGAVTDRILVNLAKYFPYIQDSDEVTGSFEYQARMLAKMGQVNRETAQIILDTLGDADGALRGSLEAAILDALKNEEPALRKAAEKGLLNGPGFLPPAVAPSQTQAFQAYYRQSADKLNLVNTVMLESTQTAYTAAVSDVVNRIQRTQSILNVGAGEVVTGVSSWNTAMHDAVKKMVQNGLTGFIDHGGHHWSPETYVAMDIRTTMFNTARAAVAERAEEYGCDLYQVSSHNAARPLCFPWQGKVISRGDWSGEVEDLNGNKVHVYAQSETSYGQAAGLFGVNCKHYPMTFIPGFSTLKGQPQDPEENEKAYAESQEQRRLERKLREERRDLAVMKAQGADEAAIKAQKAKVRKASDEIDQFCEDTGRARRRNREYTPVNATWPEKDTYDPAAYPTETRERVEYYFTGRLNTTEMQPAEKALTDSGGSGTISVSSQEIGDDVQAIATIQNQAVINHWGKVDTNVVLTDERIVHIREGHEDDYLAYGDKITATIEQPDYILDDAKNSATALFVKRVEQSNLNVVVRLKIEGSDADDLHSSVITMYRLGDKTLKRLLKKNKLLYTKPGV